MRDVGGKIPLPRLMRLSQLTLIGSARISTNGGMHPGRIYGREERSYKDGFRVYRQRAAKAWHFALGSLNAERDADNILERLLEKQAGKAGVTGLRHCSKRFYLSPTSRNDARLLLKAGCSLSMFGISFMVANLTSIASFPPSKGKLFMCCTFAMADVNP